jgi:hypothetical protein
MRILTESVLQMHRFHVPGCSPFNVFAIYKSLSIFYASMSGARTGGVGFWNRLEVVGTPAVRSRIST